MSTRIKYLSVMGLIVVVLGSLVAWRIVSNARLADARHVMPPLPVDTTLAVIKPMPIQLTVVGQVQSEHTVLVQPQVSGMLQRVYFHEGQYVHMGQPLFLIDPAPFQAAVASAKAAYLTAKAQADREAPLAAKDYVAPQAYESAAAAATQAKAALQQAEINLSYTTIRSPINGLTGNLTVRADNLVSQTAATPLVTINQMQPILVQFNVPQQFLPRVLRYNAKHSIRVFVSREDGSGNLGEGDLVFIDNSVNTSTGTVMLKARIPNQTTQLWPGQYVSVEMRLAIQPDAVVIPQTAVQAGQNGNFVYTVVNRRAVILPVTEDRQVGDEAVIAKGLKAGEIVITRVPRTLRANMPVIVRGAIRTPAASTASP